MKVSALLMTTDYRGDHSADVKIALDVYENMSIKELIETITTKFGRRGINSSAILSGGDYIELRVVQGMKNDQHNHDQ